MYSGPGCDELESDRLVLKDYANLGPRFRDVWVSLWVPILLLSTGWALVEGRAEHGDHKPETSYDAEARRKHTSAQLELGRMTRRAGRRGWN